MFEKDVSDEESYHIPNYPNRTICGVLCEMREAYNTRNFSYLLALIEEIQFMANRMEAALSDNSDILQMKKTRSRMKDELKDLKREILELRNIKKNLLEEQGRNDESQS